MSDWEPGDRVELVRCNDLYDRIEPGLRGTVSDVDDLGTVHVNWDNGSRLGICEDDGDEIMLISGQRGRDVVVGGSAEVVLGDGTSLGTIDELLAGPGRMPSEEGSMQMFRDLLRALGMKSPDKTE